MLQAVIFDFDGVIANSEPLHLGAFQFVLVDADEYYARYLGYDDAGVFQHLSRDRALAFDNGTIAALVVQKEARMQTLLDGGTVLYAGAAEFIRQCAAVIPVAIASGAARQEILEILDSAGLRDTFQIIVAAGDTPEGKPSPQPYRLAFERLQQSHGVLDARRCVAIEDSHWGLTSARDAGLRCVAVTTSYSADALDAELVVEGLGALSPGILDNLVSGDR